MTKNISHEMLEWDRYKDASPDQALEMIYNDAKKSSRKSRDWYWKNIRGKKIASSAARYLAFLFLAAGTACPLLSANLTDASYRIACTHWGLAFLAVAGLLQLLDRAFGWSSGWMRYITTVTTMEGLSSDFELTWTEMWLAKADPPTQEDVLKMFVSAKEFVQQLTKIQVDETNGWIAEFNAGINLLDAAIKSQREETNKKLDKLKADAEALKNEKRPGGINVEIAFKGDAKPISIHLNEAIGDENFLGVKWSRAELEPGIYTVTIKEVGGQNQIQQSVEVNAGKISVVEIKLPF